MIIKNGYEANIKALEVQDQVLKSTMDILV